MFLFRLWNRGGLGHLCPKWLQKKCTECPWNIQPPSTFHIAGLKPDFCRGPCCKRISPKQVSQNKRLAKTMHCTVLIYVSCLGTAMILVDSLSVAQLAVIVSRGIFNNFNCLRKSCQTTVRFPPGQKPTLLGKQRRRKELLQKQRTAEKELSATNWAIPTLYIPLPINAAIWKLMRAAHKKSRK